MEHSKTTRTCQCVHPFWSWLPQSKNAHILAFLGPHSCQSPAYFEGDLPPDFFTYNETWPQDGLPEFSGLKKHQHSPTPTHPLSCCCAKGNGSDKIRDRSPTIPSNIIIFNVQIQNPLGFCWSVAPNFHVFFQAQTAHLPFLPTSPSRAAKGYEPSPALRTTWPSPWGKKHWIHPKNGWHFRKRCWEKNEDVAKRSARTKVESNNFLDFVQLWCSTRKNHLWPKKQISQRWVGKNGGRAPLPGILTPLQQFIQPPKRCWCKLHIIFE